MTYFGHLLTLSRETRKERDRHARYLAVRVVCILDPFVNECCEVVSDRGFYDAEGLLTPEVNHPSIAFPDDVDWKSIRPDLMYRMLTLPNEIDSAEKTIRFVGEVVSSSPDYDEWFDERRYQFAKLGLAALQLATEIRNTYGLPHRDYNRWDPKSTLLAAFEKEDRMRARGTESVKKIVASAKKKAKKGKA